MLSSAKILTVQIMYAYPSGLLWIIFSIFGGYSVFGLEPSFDVPVINVTVHEGDTALLPCSVDFLGDHKVVWTDQWSTLLTLDDRRIIDDPRISIERPYMRDWNLHIRKTTYNDRGQYTCQINTKPVKTKTVMLIVLVPSKIVNELSSRDQTVTEGATVTLVCNVTGVPTPNVTWFKLPNDGTQTKQSIGSPGEILIIHNVSRYCDGVYECLAYNFVDPAVTRQMKVFVEFSPKVSLPTRKIGQYIGRETIMDCEITAFPHSLMYWTRNGSGNDLLNKDKYQVELYSGSEESTRKTLSLRVRDIREEDFGEYICFALNSLGQDKSSLILYDYAVNTKPKVTTPRPALLLSTIGSQTQTTTSIVTTRRTAWIKQQGLSTDLHSRGHYIASDKKLDKSGESISPLGYSNVGQSDHFATWSSIIMITGGYFLHNNEIWKMFHLV